MTDQFDVVAVEPIGPDNEGYFYSSADVDMCTTCGLVVDEEWMSATFVPPRREFELSHTYDGVTIVGRELSGLIRAWPGVQLDPLPAADGVFRLRATQLVEFDVEMRYRRCLTRALSADGCRGWRSGAAVGPSRRWSFRMASRSDRCRCGGELELDSIHHLEGWTPIEPEEFVRQVTELTAGDRWVFDGNYAPVVRDGVVWERADTVVWLDVSKWRAMWQVTRRTISRAIHRTELWNGNREEWRNVLSWDPERSMIRWVWTTHGPTRQRYLRLMNDERFAHVHFVRLRNRRAVSDWLDAIDCVRGS